MPAIALMRSLSLLALLLVLVGCAGPLVQEEQTDPQVDAADQRESQPSEAEAVSGLSHQAREHYQQGNYSAAIAAAERGLRINRRTPELYLVLAQSYFQMAQHQQADQFAQQGLRYSEPGSVLSEALQAMRELVSARQPLHF
ncbi:hypothetical protein [Marinimicrobium alkaliphilum]|uniref:hypothetical protein n=1 Tax=Marinimicrobium alkaliphilum TaxID=2202654 RepID=UPI000DB9E598|nr:hypothetical protein [Marinimicrobium alkaliphilum]